MYIVVPPSVHPNGNKYSWKRDFCQQDNGQCAIISDEGSIFDVLGGLYTNNIANIDVLLKGWDKGNISMKRRECEINIEPLLTFCVLAQPAVLNKISAKKSFSGFGLLERFLMWYPQSNIGYRTHNGASIQKDIIDEYNKFIKGFLDIPMSETPLQRINLQCSRLSGVGYKLAVKTINQKVAKYDFLLIFLYPHPIFLHYS